LPAPGPETVYYGGNTSCVEVRVGGEIIILDAGTGIRKLGLALVEEFKDRPIHLNVLHHAHALGPHPGLSVFSARLRPEQQGDHLRF
jgi:phosphoribosyl 1,2-cyclic phosphodiesterase